MAIISRSCLDHHETWTYYRAILLLSIKYPLPSISLTPTNCASIKKLYKPSILQKCRYNKDTPNELVYGSTTYRGLGLQNLYSEQGTSQLQALSSLRSIGPQQSLTIIAISWAQLPVGTGAPILEDITTPLPHIYPMKWIPSIHQFFTHIQGKLMLEHNFVMPLQCEHDIHIMNLTLHYTRKSTILKITNNCRLFLQIELLSNITTCDGKTIQSNAVEGIRTTMPQPTTMCLYQPNPNCKAWLTWKGFLLATTCNSLHSLHTTLG